MMRLPLPVIFAALVVAAAGSVLVNMYFKSDGAYVLDVSDLQFNQTKVVELDYIPSKIVINSNKTYALYEVHIYIDGIFKVASAEPTMGNIVYENEYSLYGYNGTRIEIKTVDVRSTHVKIVVKYIYNAML